MGTKYMGKIGYYRGSTKQGSQAQTTEEGEKTYQTVKKFSSIFVKFEK